MIKHIFQICLEIELEKLPPLPRKRCLRLATLRNCLAIFVSNHQVVLCLAMTDIAKLPKQFFFQTTLFQIIRDESEMKAGLQTV